MSTHPSLSLWVVYDHPRDMPEQIVARRHEVRARRSRATNDVITGATVEAVRQLLPPGLYCVPRHPLDEPQIVEVWL